jgi:UDP-glucose 4-epimerase
MSSVAVHGIPDHFPVTSSSPCAPINAYGRSKLRAEAAIREVLAGQSVRWAILRPVLVYGPGNPGNMSRLEGLLKRGIPIPVEQQPNRKAFLFIGNLISVIQSFLSSKHPVSGNAWIVADEQVVSTEDLVRAMAAAMNLPGRVIRLPRWVLTATARTGDALRRLGLPFPWNSETQEKLLGDHWVDTDAIQRELEWKAPYSTTEGIRLTFLR